MKEALEELSHQTFTFIEVTRYTDRLQAHGILESETFFTQFPLFIHNKITGTHRCQIILPWPTQLAVSKIRTMTRSLRYRGEEAFFPCFSPGGVCVNAPLLVAQGFIHWQRSPWQHFEEAEQSPAASLQEPSLFPSEQACGQPSLPAAWTAKVSRGWSSSVQSHFARTVSMSPLPNPYFSPQALSYHTNPPRAS